MRFLIAFCTSAVLLSCNYSKNQALKTSTFWVRGNCGMCKERLESTALALSGCASATYEISTKRITITYDSSKLNEENFHVAFASAGHSTKVKVRDAKAHSDLPECCREGYVHD